jgi:hypothetical protein
LQKFKNKNLNDFIIILGITIITIINFFYCKNIKFIIIYKSDSLWITLVEKTLKTQSIIEILLLDSKKTIQNSNVIV